MPDQRTGQPEPDAGQVPPPEGPVADSTTSEPTTPETLTVVPLRATTVAVRPGVGAAALVWRRRAEAVRAKLPELARNPVLVGASAAAATVVARIAVEVARELLTGDGSGRPARSSARSSAQTSAQPVALAVTAQVVHHIHVIHHEYVVHHSGGTAPGLPAAPRR